MFAFQNTKKMCVISIHIINWHSSAYIVGIIHATTHLFVLRKQIENVFGDIKRERQRANVATVFWLGCFKRTTSPHLSRKWAACWDRSFRKGLVPSLSCKLHSIFSNLWQFVLTAPTCSHVPSAPVGARTRERFTLSREWDGPRNKIHFTDALTHAGLFDIIFIPGLS